ncbi:MAG: tRNA (guanosine(37)-N1)-methyltransferase TrmD [Oligosphaeraceae bacterium]|nr:tRNA (guanosine(37)-N1)-methyltransferase TrmD [Oligosphaeraceae bacterium]
MRLDIVSLFPSICAGALGESIIGRAWHKGLVEINLVDLRDFTHDARRTVDDSPYGGGAGMVLRPEPLFECLSSLTGPESRVVLLCPQGQPFTQGIARRYACLAHLILVCGHYEGVDERARQCLMHEELSLGDYVLTNGALAASVVADAVIRLLPGVLGSADSSQEESFSQGDLLEYPQYTRPVDFRGMGVPAVLLSGDHQRIAQWRAEQRWLRTLSRRPDLLQQHFDTQDNGDDNEHD